MGFGLHTITETQQCAFHTALTQGRCPPQCCHGMDSVQLLVTVTHVKMVTTYQKQYRLNIRSFTITNMTNRKRKVCPPSWNLPEFQQEITPQLNHLTIYGMNCQEILYKHSSFSEDKSLIIYWMDHNEFDLDIYVPLSFSPLATPQAFVTDN